MSYPDAFCVKCKVHTATVKKHTVMLSSSARAVTGKCPNCGSSVYKILPQKGNITGQTAASRSNLVSINHHRLMATSASKAAALPEAQKFHGLSFLGGMLAGVIVMLATIVGKAIF
jgi:hypothetical protein